ncbi:MAG: peptide deformylase [Candidatus Omnitrophica bacterium]|nr:peptide deformylase [Candidatus Omnitrophota bacterium]
MNLPKLKIRLYGDPCLRKKSKNVDEVGVVERLLIRAMIRTMQEQKGIGLAAPQVGINQRILVADIGDGPIAVINPVVKRKSGSAVLEEGCLSIPEVHINVTRPFSVTVEYMDIENNIIEQTFENLMARVILHEMDHIDGKLIVDYATKEELQKINPVLEKIEQLQKGPQ